MSGFNNFSQCQNDLKLEHGPKKGQYIFCSKKEQIFWTTSCLKITR
jgi:hypothetical protein